MSEANFPVEISVVVENQEAYDRIMDAIRQDGSRWNGETGDFR